MEKGLFKIFNIVSLLIIIFLVSCQSNYENVVDDERIYGTWHRKSYIENGITINESDSIVYHFLNNGNMKIRYFAVQNASPPDEDYQFDFQLGVLRYWNSDINVSEEKQVNFYGSKMRIQLYSNYYYELSKIF